MANWIGNPVGLQSDLGNVIKNLGTAMFGGPSPDERRTKQAQADYHSALAGKTNAERQLLDSKITGQSELGSIFGSLDPRDPESIRAATARMAAVATRAGLKPEDLGHMMLFAAANGGGDNATVGRAMVGTGKAIKPDDAFTVPGQTVIRRDNERQDNNKLGAQLANAINLENIRQTGETGRNTANNDRALKIESGKPFNTPAGTTTSFAPNDPRVSGPKLQGVPTDSTSKGAIISTADAARTPIDQLSPVAQAVIGHAAKAPPLVNGKTVDDMWYGVYRSYNALDDKGRPDPAKIKLDPASRAAIEKAGVDEYRRTGGNSSAGTAAMEQKLKDVVRDLGAPQPDLTPVAPVAPGAQAPGAQAPAPNAAPAVQMAPQSPAQRVKGQTYNTPRGPMIWTGTGWLPSA